jgi:two-component system, NtrC family, sensor histidine kinase HydH
MKREPFQSEIQTAERVKPFRLVKYFTLISLVVIFIGALVLSVLNVQWSRSIELEKSEKYALALIESLNHQIFLQFVIPVALQYGKVQLREKEQFERMDKVVRSTLHSFQVERVNVYDRTNIISYSYDKDMIGKMNAGGSGFENAVNGKITSTLIRKGNFWQLVIGMPEEVRMVTFGPFRAEKLLSSPSGPILGVVEIEQDLTDDYQRIFVFQTRIILTSAGVMGMLFVVLLLVVRRGERIIEIRAQERMKLKEDLAKARHLSSLGELTAGISHEIRNPLGIIQSSAALLKKKMAGLDPKNTIADIIVEESKRLNAIITDFLSYARPRSPQFRSCHVEEILERNIRFLEPQLLQGHHRIRPISDEGSPEISADPDMLYQAFLNILLNGIQAMPEGGEITVNLSRNGQHLILLFEDEGIGIPEEAADSLLDPFFTTKETGTGLGLGIVQSILKSHNGTIRIENRSPKGAKVTVTLPLTQEA